MNDKAENTRTLMVMATGFIAIYLIWDLNWAIYTALVLSLAGSFSSFLSKNIAWLWMKLAWIFSLIIPKILLGLVFFLVLYPISLLSKLFGKRSHVLLRNKRDSFFQEVNKTFDTSHFEKPW